MPLGSAMVIVNGAGATGFGMTQTGNPGLLRCRSIALVFEVLDRVPERRATGRRGRDCHRPALGAVLAAYTLSCWFVTGLGYSLAQTPSGRLLRQLFWRD
jgi:hypothetical protein